MLAELPIAKGPATVKDRKAVSLLLETFDLMREIHALDFFVIDN
jgi:hypothetical protein